MHVVMCVVVSVGLYAALVCYVSSEGAGAQVMAGAMGVFAMDVLVLMTDV